MYSRPEIARLEELRQAVGTAEISPETLEFPSGGWATYDYPGSWSNQAVGLGLSGEASESELDQLVAFYTSRGVEPRVELAPFAHASVRDGLYERGFRLREFGNVMARHLTPDEDLQAALSHPLPDGYEVAWIDPDDDDLLRECVTTACRGFIPEGTDPDEDMLGMGLRCAKYPRCDTYAVTHEGRVVGSGAMESAAPVAGLFGASVLSDHRRRGIQAALIAARLERAREKGCKVACIHSEPGIPTERNAERLGFFLAYTKVVLTLPGEGLVPSP
ncbi:MAG: GNAT family N-acetyltransferase [Acidobacteriota bacterium]